MMNDFPDMNWLAIEWCGTHLRLLDQRQLPHTQIYLDIHTVADAAAAITNMVVRGAPAIGVTAAYGAVLAARNAVASGEQWQADYDAALDTLARSRPTAINLHWAVARMRKLAASTFSQSADMLEALEAEAKRVHAEDIRANQLMGEIGAAILEPAEGIITHCNTGTLATGGYGTALGVVRSGWERGAFQRVYAGETRPWLQGARLTAWELTQDGIPVSLMADGAGAWLMRSGGVRWVVVGADRVAANGDVANKIGTYSLAVSARQHGLGFMVVAPTSTIDLDTADGNSIPIETRGVDEVLTVAGTRVAPAGADAWNPVFDVTPATLVDVLVTERGAVFAPSAAGIADLF